MELDITSDITSELAKEPSNHMSKLRTIDVQWQVPRLASPLAGRLGPSNQEGFLQLPPGLWRPAVTYMAGFRSS